MTLTENGSKSSQHSKKSFGQSLKKLGDLFMKTTFKKLDESIVVKPKSVNVRSIYNSYFNVFFSLNTIKFLKFFYYCVGVSWKNAHMHYVFNCLSVSVLCEINFCVCVCGSVCPQNCVPVLCMLAHFATNYITPKQLNEQVNGVNSS